MIAYLGLFGATFLTGLFFETPFKEKEVNRRQDKYFLIVSWLLLSFIEGFRGLSVGTDTLGYATTYESLDSAYGSYEILSRLLVDFVRLFSKSATVYFVVCALLVNGLILMAIYRMSSDKKYSLFLFISLLFYFTSFNALRQAIAYAFMLNAFYYVRENKIIKFAIFFLIAVGFHSSALIGIVYLLIPLISWNKKRKVTKRMTLQTYTSLKNALVLFATFGLSFVAYLWFDDIVQLFAELLPRYEVYLHNSYRDLAGGIQQPIVYSAIFVCFVLLVPTNAKYRTAYMLPLSVAVVLSFAALKMAYIARLMYYFDITAVIVIPYIYKNSILDRESLKIFKFAVTFICVAFLVYGLANNYMRVTDYKFIWSD